MRKRLVEVRMYLLQVHMCDGWMQKSPLHTPHSLLSSIFTYVVRPRYVTFHPYAAVGVHG